LKSWVSIASVMLVGLLGVACGIHPQQASAEGADSRTSANDRLVPEYDKAGKLTRLAYDEDGDGKVDRWEYHRNLEPGAVRNTSPDGTDPTVVRIERATRHDGHVSRWEYFDNGVLTRVEEDTDGDGKIDKWATYTNGTLSELALDTTGRGKPDRRLMYGPDGALDRIETDPTGSGNFMPLPQKASQ
jgi:hypothetical protein